MKSFFYTSLSTSSRRKTGLLTPTNRRPCIILPGMEPIYVLLCPLISDWSHIPPRAILQKWIKCSSAKLQNLIIPFYNYKKIIFWWIIRPVEFSAKCLSNGFPHTGFPHPWGSYKAQNGALQGILQLPHSQVLDHSLFQFIQSVMIGVQIFPVL